MWTSALKLHERMRTIHRWNSTQEVEPHESLNIKDNNNNNNNNNIVQEQSSKEVDESSKEMVTSHLHIDGYADKRMILKRLRVENDKEVNDGKEEKSLHCSESFIESGQTNPILEGEEVNKINYCNKEAKIESSSLIQSLDQEVIVINDEEEEINANDNNISEAGCGLPFPAEVLSPNSLRQDELPESKTHLEASLIHSETESPKPTLSEEQQRVFDLVVRRGRSVLLTGGAGTGKSHLLRAIISALPRASTFVTATTGIAALNLGGTTLHSFAGCGIVDPQRHQPIDVFYEVEGKKKAKRNWKWCQVLVVDEVSMMDAWFFDVLEFVARKIRGNQEPFGGIQLVLSGDFLQLPPVVKNKFGNDRQEARFCFEADSWCRINPLVCVLSQRFRQKDEAFFTMLNEMRRGELTAASLALLTSLSTTTTVRFFDEKREKKEEKEQLRLFNKFKPLDIMEDTLPQSSNIKNEETSSPAIINKHNTGGVVDGRGRSKHERYEGFTILRALRSEVEAINKERFDELDTDIYLYNGFHRGEGKFPGDLPAEVKLRAGCRVMLLKNIDVSLGLVNGSVGTLERFIDSRKVNDFANKTTPIDIRNIASHSMLPVVKFDVYSNGNNTAENSTCGRTVIVEPHRWTVMQGDREISCSIQIPLQLAYAITIHKSQGMTLSRVNVDFKGIFEEGQAYVALSRCSDMQNLVVENFDAHRVNPNAKALAYYKALEEVEVESVENEDNDTEEQDESLFHGGNCPWGFSSLNNDDNNNEAKNFNTSDLIEEIRQRLTPTYVLWSNMRQKVLSNVERASSIHGALFVMDITSILALGSSLDHLVIYEKVFLNQQNMMRVPRVVKEEILRTASQDEVEVRMTPTVRLSFNSVRSNSPHAFSSSCTIFNEASEVAAATLCIMEDAKSDFVLDEQRDGESRPIPPLSPQWEILAPLLSLPTTTTTKDIKSVEGSQSTTASSRRRGIEQQLRVLEFACYLLEQCGAHQEIFVCTESVELAARALAVGLRVCSLMYLCASGRR